MDPIISIACGLPLRDFSYIISIKDHMHTLETIRFTLRIIIIEFIPITS